MKLLLLRHAEAVPGDGLDPRRELTPYGKAQAKAMAVRVQAALPEARVVASPWIRARQTAEAIALELQCPVSELQPLIASAGIEEAAAALEPFFATAEPLVVVTHQPLCGQLIGWLTEGDRQGRGISTCSGALLELEWPARSMARLLAWYDSENAKKAT